MKPGIKFIDLLIYPPQVKISGKHNRKVSVGNTHSFAHFLQAWQYVCAQFSAAEWDIRMFLHHHIISMVPRDRILPIAQPLAQHVKHYKQLTGV